MLKDKTEMLKAFLPDGCKIEIGAPGGSALQTNFNDKEGSPAGLLRLD